MREKDRLTKQNLELQTEVAKLQIEQGKVNIQHDMKVQDLMTKSKLVSVYRVRLWRSDLIACWVCVQLKDALQGRNNEIKLAEDNNQ